MAKQADVEFRIRSRNLSAKSITKVTEELNDLIDAQERQRTTAAASSATLTALQQDYKKLATSLDAVKAAQKSLDNLARDQAKFAKVAVSIRETIAALDKLRQGQAKLKAAGSMVPPELTKNIAQLEAGLNKMLGSARTLQQSVAKQRKDLGELGVDARDTAKAYRQLATVEGTIAVAQTRTTQAINATSVALDKQEKKTREVAAAEQKLQAELADSIRFEQERAAAARKAREGDIRAAFADADEKAQQQAAARLAREKEVTAEVLRRTQLERQASEQRLREARQLGAEQQRIAAKRADAFAAFSAATPAQLRTPADRATILAQEQTRARDAALRMLEINQRADAVEKRLAETRKRLGVATGKLAKDTSRAGTATRLFNDDTRRSLGVMQRVRGQLLSLASAYFGLFGAINVVRGAFEAVTTQQAIEIKLRVANQGDPKAAAEDYNFLRQSAEDLGLEFVVLAKKFADYKIAAQSAGVTNDLIKQSFLDVSKAISVNRLSQDDADGVLRAMVQIMSKARVQAEELRGQLGDRLPGAVAMFAKANNIALSDLDEKLKKGEVGVDFLLRGLRGYAATVAKELPAATNTAQASLNRLKNAYREFLVTLGKSGVVDSLKDIFVQLTEFFRSGEGEQAAKRLGEAFRTFGEVVKTTIVHLDDVIFALKIMLGLKVLSWANDIRIALLAWFNILIKIVPALRAAAAGTGALAVASRGLLALFGPIGIAATAAAAAIYAFDRANRQAAENTEKFITSLGRLKNAQGNAIIGEMKSGVAELRQRQKELKDLQDRLAKAEQADPLSQKSATLRGRLFGSTSLDAVLGESPVILREQIKLATTQLEGLATGVKNAATRYKEFRTEASKDIPIPDFTPPKSDEEGKKDNSAEKARRLAERIAEQRLAIEHKTADALLDIEKDIAQARVDTNIVSQEQIEANLKQTLAAIDIDIQKKRADLEKMKADASKIGATTAVGSSDAALEQLKVLQDIQISRAKEKATLESMQLLEKQLNDTIEVRDQKLEAIATKQELHLVTEFEARQEAQRVQREAADEILRKATALRDFLVANAGALSKMMNVDAVILGMDNLILKTKEAASASDSFLQAWGGEIAQGVADTFAAFGAGLADFITGAGSLSDAFKSARDAFLQFASDFLINIGKMIIQAIILKAIQNAINGTSGGYWQAAMGVINGGTAHTGGMVGSPRHSRRAVPALTFANAPRYHSGGFPGMRADEIPIVAQRGEEVLSRTDPRNALNGGTSGQAPSVKIINAIDSASVVSEAMNQRDGQTPIINMMRARRQEVKAALGIA